MLYPMTLSHRRQRKVVPGRHQEGWCGLRVTRSHSSGHGSVHGCLKAEDAVLDAGRTLGLVCFSRPLLYIRSCVGSKVDSHSGISSLATLS